MPRESARKKRNGSRVDPERLIVEASDVVSHETSPIFSAPAMTPVEQLIPYSRNSRTHDEDQVLKIARSIEQFGFTNPILAMPDGTIIAGHGRLMAAKRLKLSYVPVITARNWSDAQMRAYVIADNKLALDAGWDEDMLKLELGELAEIGIDLEETGFSAEEMDQLFGRVAQDLTPPDTGAKLDGLSYSIVVRCKSEQHQGELLERFEAEGLTAEALIS